MPELTTSERLQPCLLDRITDHQPEVSASGRERRVFSMAQMREAVLRDLAWLLNTGTRLRDDRMSQHPGVQDSVLNYGMPDLCGMTASSVDTAELERAVAQTIERFEPRILRNSIEVRVIRDDYAMGTSALTFEIRADLWAQPSPDPLFLKTSLDLETGQYNIQEHRRA